jgi:5-hydroxyisourate hydrolase-like protein (transthyretin family)
VDDRGDYRIFGVAPGRYYLVAGTLPGPAALRGLLSLPGGPTTRFSVVYYPNSTGLDQASSIEVKPQGEATVDMRVTRQTKTFTVRGRIVDGTGAGIPQNLNIMLGWRSFNSGGAAVGARTVDAVTGAFEMQNVPPGEYTVQAQLAITGAAALAARRGGQASEPGASVPIRVVDSDIEGLVLTLTTGSAITGRVVVDGRPVSSVPNLDKQRIILENLAASSGMLAIPSSVAIAADGTFQLNSMREGEYRLQMAVPGFYVKGVKYGGDEILGKPFKVSGNGSETLEVTLRASTATASGTVSDSKTLPVSGVNVVFAPADRNRVDLFRTAPTDQNGRYSISNLAPGEYTAFSWESIENYAYFDPEFLRQYEQLGKAIVVSDTTNPRVDLKLIPVQ